MYCVLICTGSMRTATWLWPTMPVGAVKASAAVARAVYIISDKEKWVGGRRAEKPQKVPSHTWVSRRDLIHPRRKAVFPETTLIVSKRVKSYNGSCLAVTRAAVTNEVRTVSYSMGLGPKIPDLSL